MLDLVSLIKTVIRAEMAGQPSSAFGVVDVVHLPDAGGLTQYACDVTLQGTDTVYEKVPICTAYLGQLAPPMVGDVVVVQFIGADPDAALISGMVFSEQTPAPEMADGERLIRLPHTAKPEDQIEMRQTAGRNGSRIWRVTLPDGPEMQLTDTAISTTLGDFALVINSEANEATLTTGAATLTMDGDGNITLIADADFTLEAGGNLTLKAGGDVGMDASGSMALKASKIELN